MAAVPALLTPVPYFGGKTLLAPRIAALLPEHLTYVEPFAGSLAVLLAKARVPSEYVNDLDGELMTFWRVLRDRPDELRRVAEFTPHSLAEYERSFQPVYGPDELEIARRVWVRLTQGRTPTLRRHGWRYRVDLTANSTPLPAYIDAYRTRLPAAAARLFGVSLECRPALEMIALYGREESVLIYADPPYLGETRTATIGKYRMEMNAEVEHRALAAALRAVPAAVVLSGYASPLYEQLYEGWHRVDIETATGQDNVWSARTECLWSNRPLTTQPMLF